MEKGDLQDYLWEQIPITRSMGIEVQSASLLYGSKGVTLSAPLPLNINHKKTAFGGSLNTLSITAAWCVSFLILREANITAEVVIQDNHTQFKKPVVDTLVAHAPMPSMEERELFVQRLRRGKSSRITLGASILSQGKEALVFSGRFVGIPQTTIQ